MRVWHRRRRIGCHVGQKVERERESGWCIVKNEERNEMKKKERKKDRKKKTKNEKKKE